MSDALACPRRRVARRPAVFALLVALLATSLPSLAHAQANLTAGLFPQLPGESAPAGPTAEATRPQVRAAFAGHPVTFVPNTGQGDPRVRFHGRGPGYAVYFTPEEAVFAFVQRTPGSRRLATPAALSETELATRGLALALRFLGANPNVTVEGRQEAPGKVNYLIGNDPARWRTGLPTYQEVVYRDLWPGVDLVFRQARGHLKYEFVVHPGARVEAIRLAYRGADGLSLDASGNLLIRTPLGTLTDSHPASHQETGGKRVPVESRFELAADGVYSFALGAGYDPRYALIIDPGIGYSTFLGGAGKDVGNAIAVDAAGNAYVTGSTTSANFPIAGFSFDATFNGGTDAFVAKFDPDGILVYATYLGGNGTDEGIGIAVWCNTVCNVYVTGNTNSTNFPVQSTVQASLRGLRDIFVTKLDPTGASLVFSTYLGGSRDDQAGGIAVDASGNAYVGSSTFSSNFPTSKNKFQSQNRGGWDGALTKLTSSGGLVYSTYLGGSGDDFINGIAVDGANNAYVTGSTASTNFPRTTGAYQTTQADGGAFGDAFVVKMNATGTVLLYGTYLGGNQADSAHGVDVDAAGKIYITGYTRSANFPHTLGSFNGSGLADAFVAKLDPFASTSVQLVYSVLLGGDGTDVGDAIAVDDSGNAFVAGYTDSGTQFPGIPTTLTFDPLVLDCRSNTDAFVASVAASGSGLLYAACLGGNPSVDMGHGIALHPVGTVYVTGEASASDFLPIVQAYQSFYQGGTSDAFVTKLTVGTSTAVTSSTNSSTFGQSVTFTATVSVIPPGAGTPTGIVTFKDGATTLETKTLSASGQVTFNTASLAAGTHAITATYQGDTFFSASTGTLDPALVVNPAPTTTAISAPAITYNASGVVTVTVTSAAGIPPGNVSLTVDGGSPMTEPLVGGSATFTLLSPGAGDHPLSASYPAQGNFDASSATGNLHVNPAPTTTAISAPTITYNASGVVTVTVTSAAGIPTGNVSLTVDGGPAMTQTLTGGSATFTLLSPGAGDHPLSASYPAQGNFDASSATGNLHVNPAPTTTTISAPTITYNANGLVTVTVSSAAGIPTGNVSLTVDGGAAVTQALFGGTTTFTVVGPNAGDHPLSASFLGSQNFAPSGPVAGNLHVNKAPTMTSVTSSLNPSQSGQEVTFTATVSAQPPGSGTPAGDVTFKDFAAVIGTPMLNAPGQATLTKSDLTVGFHSITAVYGETENFFGSTSLAVGQSVLAVPNITAVGTLSRGGVDQTFLITGTGFSAPPNVSVAFNDPLITVDQESISPTLTGLAVTVTVAQEALEGNFVDAGGTVSRTVTATNLNSDLADTFSPVPVSAPVSGQLQTLGAGKISQSLSSPPPSPTISSLTPNQGPLGLTGVVIGGSNFANKASDNAVKFAGAGGTRVPATVTSASTTSLTVTVPAGAVDGPVTVTVGGIVSNGVNFLVTSPKLASVDPAGAVQGTANVVDLYGTKLASTITTSNITFGTGITVNSVTAVDAPDPNGFVTHFQVGVAIAVGASTGFRDVTVTNPSPFGGSSTLLQAFEVKSPTRFDVSLVDNTGTPITGTWVPEVGTVTVTRDSTGKCVAPYTVTPVPVIVQADFVGASPPATATFTLLNTSRNPGTAVNENCELDPLNPRYDLSWSQTDPSVQSLSSVGPVSGMPTRFQATAWVWDWGASGTIRVTGGTFSGTLRVPFDADGDGVPNVLDPNPQNPADPTLAGLTPFDRYRGIYQKVSNAPCTNCQVLDHQRLGASRHLFVRPLGFATNPPDGKCGINPSTGERLTDSKPCPPFSVGGAFAERGIEVHDVSSSFTDTTEFPRKSLIDPTKATLDMMTVTYDWVNCKSGEPCDHTRRLGPRQWQTWTLAFSGVGGTDPNTGLLFYGAPTVVKKQVEAYVVLDKPYLNQTNYVSPLCETTTDWTTIGLPPLACTGDAFDDNGSLTIDPASDPMNPTLAAGEVAGTNAKPAGPIYDPTSFSRDFSRFDVNKDGCPDLPLIDDPNAILPAERCDPATALTASSAPNPAKQATLPQIIQLLITHEMFHACGALHDADPTSVVNEVTNNWNRAGHISDQAAAQCLIHNKGVGN